MNSYRSLFSAEGDPEPQSKLIHTNLYLRLTLLTSRSVQVIFNRIGYAAYGRPSNAYAVVSMRGQFLGFGTSAPGNYQLTKASERVRLLALCLHPALCSVMPLGQSPMRLAN